MPIHGENLQKFSSPELNKLWYLTFIQIIGEGRSTKIAKMMIVH